MPELVHGIVSLDPPSIRCDGCGFVAVGERLAFLVLTCGIEFSTKRYGRGDDRRLCRDCRAREWANDSTGL
jgi:hypothetical protein